MFGLFKKKEITEEEVQKKIEELKEKKKEFEEREEKKETFIVNHLKNILSEADDEVLNRMFDIAAYMYIISVSDYTMRRVNEDRPSLSFSESNLFSSTMKNMFDRYLNWKNNFDCKLNNCLMKAIKQIKADRKNDDKDKQTSCA